MRSVTPEAAELSARLDRIQKLTAELTKCQQDAIEQQALRDKIVREIKAAKTHRSYTARLSAPVLVARESAETRRPERRLSQLQENLKI